MKANLQQTKLTMMHVAFSGLTTHTYRASEPWHSQSAVLPNAEDTESKAAQEPAGGSYNLTQAVISGNAGTSGEGRSCVAVLGNFCLV